MRSGNKAKYKKKPPRKVFIPEAYLLGAERRLALDLKGLGVGKIYRHADFNRLMRNGVIDKSVVIDFQFIILEGDD